MPGRVISICHLWLVRLFRQAEEGWNGGDVPAPTITTDVFSVLALMMLDIPVSLRSDHEVAVKLQLIRSFMNPTFDPVESDRVDRVDKL